MPHTTPRITKDTCANFGIGVNSVLRLCGPGRFGLSQEVWDRMGVEPAKIIPYVLADPTRSVFQQMLFSKIVPNCKKLGLLDAADGWLRDRFTEIGVIQFEDWADTGEEYGDFALDQEPAAAAS